MSWRDSLQPGSYRGAEFHTEQHEHESGRRAATHEFALRDTPYTEDLGRRARRWNVEAYVIGDDYMTKRDALLAACEAAGPAELVHPYLGRKTVHCIGIKISESRTEGRMAVVTMQFVEAGQETNPGVASDTASAIAGAANLVDAGAGVSFADIFSIAKLPEFLAVSAATEIFNIVTSIMALARSGGGANLDGAKILSDPGAFVRLPAPEIARTLQAVTGESVSVSIAARQQAGVLQAIQISARELSQPVFTTTRTRRIERDNLVAINDLTRSAIVTAVARSITGVEFETYDDAVKARDQTVAAIDELSEKVQDDTLYRQLITLRGKVQGGIPSPDEQLPRLSSIRLAGTLPSLVVAYDALGDAGRDHEVVGRNRIRHPGFVPGGRRLEVIANG